MDRRGEASAPTPVSGGLLTQIKLIFGILFVLVTFTPVRSAKDVVAMPDFSKEVVKVAVAQIAYQGGFEVVEGEAYETLSTIVGSFIEAIGRGTASLSTHDSRTKSNFLDLLGAFESSRPPVDWTKLKKMCETVHWDVPFIQGIPRYPVHADRETTEPASKKRKREPTPEADERRPLGVGPHLPPLPPPHLYQETSFGTETLVAQDVKRMSEQEVGELRRSELERRWQVKESLAKIAAVKLASSATALDVASTAPAGVAPKPPSPSAFT